MDFIENPSVSFARPADTNAYAVGDLVANSTVSANVIFPSITAARFLGHGFMLRRASLRKTSGGTTNASFRIHLFRSAPTINAGADNASFALLSGVADYLGAFDVTIDRAFADGSIGIGAPSAGHEISAKLTSGQSVFIAVEALAAYTPTSGETFTLTFEDFQN
jgi:hypothetical protein